MGKVRPPAGKALLPKIKSYKYKPHSNTLQLKQNLHSVNIKILTLSSNIVIKFQLLINFQSVNILIVNPVCDF